MTLQSFERLWEKLCSGDESTEIEAKYYLPGRRLLAALGSLPQPEPLRTELDSLRPEFLPLRTQFAILRGVATRSASGLLRLTAWRPFALEDQASIGRKSPAYPHPDEPNHPEQKYTAGTST